MGSTEPSALVREIPEIRAQTRKYRIFFTVFLLLLFAVFGLQIYGLFRSFDEDQLLAALDRRVVRDVWPMAASELEQVRRKVTPKLATMLADKMEQTGPRLVKALEVEGDRLRGALAKKPEAALSAAMAKSRREHRKVIAAAFPELAKESPARIDAMTEAVGNRVRQWGVNQFSGVVEEGVTAIVGIKETLDRMKPGQAEDGSVPNPEDILGLFLEIVNARLEGEDGR